LLQEQSLPKVLEALGRGRVVVSVSEQSVVSLAHGRKLSNGEAFARISAILLSKGISEVRDMQYARDLSLHASIQEFMDRYGRGTPLVCAECPGWVCYAEKKADPVILPMLSTIKSPMLVQDHLVKTADPACTHICVLPCYDKKLEAHRVASGPIVLTTKELEEWISADDWSNPCPIVPSGITTPGYTSISSHGYAEVIFAEAAYRLFGRKLSQEEIVWKHGPKRDWSVFAN
jgi:iron only hydrogenase large subunit-like protein